MAILPQGTVTFLFTDIEGSMRLVQELGPGLYGEATVDGQRALAGHGWPHDRPIGSAWACTPARPAPALTAT